MNKAIKNKIFSSQKGVSLIITFFIMIIILAIVMSVSTILYSEVKIIRNIGNTAVSFFAADSGMEKILFYDRRVLPKVDGGVPCTHDTDCVLPGYTCDIDNDVCVKIATRGICSIYSPANNQNYCPPVPPGTITEKSTYCTPTSPPQVGTTNPTHGCDPDVCNDCSIKFSTDLDDGRTYETIATVYPSPSDPKISDLKIESVGTFEGVKRAVALILKGQNRVGPESPVITNVYAVPDWAAHKGNITFTADIADEEGVNPSTVLVYIQSEVGINVPFNTETYPSANPIQLHLSTGNEWLGKYEGVWTGPDGLYYAYIVACDRDNFCSSPFYIPIVYNP